MKFTVIAVLLLSASVLSASKETVEQCAAQVAADAAVIQQVVQTLKIEGAPKAIHLLLQSAPLIRKTHLACISINEQDVSEYVFSKLSDEQKTCVLAVVKVAHSLHEILEKQKESNWADPFQSVNELKELYEKTLKPSCPPTLLHQIENLYK